MGVVLPMEFSMQERSGHGAPGPGLDIREGGGTEVRGGRPWLGVLFRCSGKYQRVFRNVDGTAYLARCPTCGKSVRFLVGSGGSSGRFFEVACGR